jgi:hypothetical protein
MVEVNDKAIRDLMINMYPQKNTKANTDFGTEINILNDTLEDNTELGPGPDISSKFPQRGSRIGLYNDSFVHPVIKKEQTQITLNIRKWLFALMISIFSVFLFSGFFLSFIDDVCMKKEMYLFDANGSPKPMLLIILFVILICFSRILFEFV